MCNPFVILNLFNPCVFKHTHFHLWNVANLRKIRATSSGLFCVIGEAVKVLRNNPLPCALSDVDGNGSALGVRQRQSRRWWARGWGCSLAMHVNDDEWFEAIVVDSFLVNVAVVVAVVVPCVFRDIDTLIHHRPLRPLRPRRRSHFRLEPPQSACWRNNTSRTFIRRELNTTASTPPHCCHHWR